MASRLTDTHPPAPRRSIGAALRALIAGAALAGPILACAATAGSMPAAAAGSLAARLEPGVRALFDAGFAPGMSVAVVKDGAIAYAQGFGVADLETGRPVGPETQFYIASTTKSFTALAAARLASEGKVDLDAPISKYLPKLRLAESLSADRITLRDLLAMTHGIENNGPVTFRSAFTGEYTGDLLLRLVAAHGPAPTGREFKYGNLGYNLAGFVLESATGKGWKDVVEAEVLRPIGMSRTTAWMSRATKDLATPYRLGGDGFVKLRRTKTDATMHAAGGHLSTVGDLARYLIVHLDRGRIDGREVVPASAIAETHRMQAAQKAKFLDYERYGWGLGWDLGTYEADTLVHRFGNFNGSFCHLSFMPARGIGVVVLASEDRAGGMLATMVANSIYDRLLEKPGAEERWARIVSEAPARAAEGRSRMAEDAQRRAARPQTTAHPLRAYVGEYENANLGRIRWTLNGGRLRASMGALESDAEIYDGTKDQVRVELTGSGEVVTFECEGETAKALIYQNARFERR